MIHAIYNCFLTNACTIIGPMYFVFCILGLFNITYVQKQILVVQSMNIWQSTKDGLNCDYQMN